MLDHVIFIFLHWSANGGLFLTTSKNVLENDKSNREGLAAKVYFHELFGLDFRRFDDDIINAGLNYGYAILRSQISKTVIAKGLNPCLGIFHKGYDNPFNLSDDIIEVYPSTRGHFLSL